MALSVVLCLLASSLVAFFLFPRVVVVVDDGIKSVTVHFDNSSMKVLMNMTVGIKKKKSPKVIKVSSLLLLRPLR